MTRMRSLIVSLIAILALSAGIETAAAAAAETGAGQTARFAPLTEEQKEIRELARAKEKERIEKAKERCEAQRAKEREEREKAKERVI